ncbi:hypothetical protein Tco_0780088 [Tanacetum coccineum]
MNRCLPLPKLEETIVANSTTEAEYVAAANCCGQVLWIQNQMMDYGFNFMNTKIHIDNESTISVIKNPVAHSRTKHIEIQFHFIRDCYEKRLIEVIKIHTDSNVADLLTKGFDVTRFNFLVGKNFSRKVTPLFDSMLVQQTEEEGEASEGPSNSQPTPSPRPSPSIAVPNSNPKGSGGNHRAQAKEIKALKAQVKKLKKGVKPLITHHKAWMKTRLARKISLKKKRVHKEYVSKQGRKSIKTFKGEPSVHKDPAFDDFDDFVDVDYTLDYMETEDVQDERGNKGTDKQDGGTDSTKVSTDRQVFGDDETIAQVLIIMSQNKEKLKEKEKGVEIRNVKETERPRPTSTRSVLTLKPLPKIDPKDKGKKRIEEEDESDTESEGITEAEKKFKQLANDEEVARKVQEEGREREMYTIEQRTKFLHDTIAAQRRFLAQQRSEAIRNKPPSRNQLRNQMMTYLKHVGGKKHSDLKTKSFDEIQVLYEKIKRSDDSFIAIGSAEDEKVIKEMNEQATDASKKRVKKDDSVKGEIKEEEGTRKRKSGHVKMIDLGLEVEEESTAALQLMLHSSSGGNHYNDYEGLVIYMLVENKYPLKKEVLLKLLELKLETEEDSTMALELIRFVKDHIVELEPKDSDRDEKDP